MSDRRSELPKMDRLLTAPLLERFGRARVVRTARRILEDARKQAAVGTVRSLAALQAELAAHLDDGVRPVINGTGVLLHTNLGRAPWGTAAVEKAAFAAGFCDVEYRLATGTRGGRGAAVEDRVCALTGAPASLVVNNCAGAVLLMLAALAKDKDVLVSRGELVEIGGGFRIPDVMAASGARLVEVGTTNRTHLADFENALGPQVAGVLRVHHSNFKQLGFVTQPTLKALGNLSTPLLVDLGSGQLEWSQVEPSVQEALDAGAAVICMSGDKLIGGPQSGLILGQHEFIETLRRHPLYRAVRPDKVILAALEGTLDDWLRGRPVPLTLMRNASLESLHAAAQEWARDLADLATLEVVESQATVGGGSLPESQLSSVALRITGVPAEMLSRILREGHPPVIGRIESDAMLIDTRTIVPLGDGPTLLSALRQALTTCRAKGVNTP